MDKTPRIAKSAAAHGSRCSVCSLRQPDLASQLAAAAMDDGGRLLEKICVLMVWINSVCIQINGAILILFLANLKSTLVGILAIILNFTIFYCYT